MSVWSFARSPCVCAGSSTFSGLRPPAKRARRWIIYPKDLNECVNVCVDRRPVQGVCWLRTLHSWDGVRIHRVPVQDKAVTGDE